MKLCQRLENLLAAAAFAEEGDFRSARCFAREAEAQAEPAPAGAAGPGRRPPASGGGPAGKRRTRLRRSKAA